MKLTREFYSRDTVTVAKELLGKILVHDFSGQVLKGRIVETEAYLGLADKAAHSYGGKRTERVKVMYGPAGISYVYLIYGMYYCFNVVTKEEGIPEAVLIRGIEPLGDINTITNNRFNKTYGELNKYQRENLTNGPGKLCIAYNIDKDLNGIDLCGNKLYLEDDNKENLDIVQTTRINIDYAEEAVDFPYRFYIKDNPYVSRK